MKPAMQDETPALPPFAMPGNRYPPGGPWQPPVDIYSGRDGWLVKFDLAGIRSEEVTIRTSGCELTVSGLRRDPKHIAGQRCWSIEIAYHRFTRTVVLPCGGEIDVAGSQYRDGMLMVMIRNREVTQ